MKLQSLLKEVSSKTHYLLAGDRVEMVSAPARQPWVLISRGDCLFFSLDVTSVPAAARRRYVEQQVQKRSPWQRFDCYISGTESGVSSVWMWDADWLDTARAGLPPDLLAARCLPETVLLPPGTEGAEAKACFEGVDYQVWEAGHLLASRWTMDELKPPEVELIKRSRDVDDLPADAGSAAQWQLEPWTEPALDWRRLIRDEAALMLGGAAAITLVVCLELGAMAALAIKTETAEGQVLNLQEALGEKLQYRLAAERLSEVNEVLSKQLPRYTQLEVVAEFTRLLEEESYELVDWEYRQGSLHVTLKNPSLDSRDAVRRLESGTFFRDIRLEPGLRDGEHDISLAINRVDS